MDPKHKDPGYNHGHVMKQGVDPDTPASVSMTYRMASRIVNVLEDLHFQMQRPQAERFADYPISDHEALDTLIRDNMANLALSIETQAQAERNS
jgi:hypothetical protein